MTALRIFLARLLGLFSGSAGRDRELRAEIDAHIAEATDEFTRQGLSPADARHAALRQFGGVTQTVEAHRELRGFTFFSTLWQDLRYAVRTLTRAPGFAIVAILTLAIGILGNTTIFSGMNALLFTPLPTERPEQIAQVLSGGGHRIGSFVKHTYKRYTSFRDTNTSFAALAAIRDVTVPIGDNAPGTGAATQIGVVRGEVSSGNYFDMLGVRAAFGRVFTPDDDRTPNGHPVVIISDRLWRTHFIADPQALGRVVYLNGHPLTVIGITPASFTGTVFANETDFWAPLMMQGQFGAPPNWWNETRARQIVVFTVRKPGGREETGPGQEVGDLRLLGRLKPDIGAEVASAELTAIAAGLAQANKLKPPKIDVVAELQARHQGGLEQVRRIATLALWASGLVWLIACGNVANLFLARASARRREIAIRLSLGAGRWRVARQLLTESTVLALAAGALAVTADVLDCQDAWRRDTRQRAAAHHARLHTRSPRAWLGPCAVAGHRPRLRTRPGVAGGAHRSRSVAQTRRERQQPGRATADAAPCARCRTAVDLRGRARRRRPVRAKPRQRREAFSPGFATDRLLSMRLDPGLLGYKAPRIDAFYRDVLRQVSEAPRSHRLALVSRPPFGGGGSASAFVVPTARPSPAQGAMSRSGLPLLVRATSRRWEIPLVAGRDFDARDTVTATPVAILSASEARRLFGSAEGALGKRIILERRTRANQCASTSSALPATIAGTDSVRNARGVRGGPAATTGARHHAGRQGRVSERGGVRA